MTHHQLSFERFPGTYAVCRLAPAEPIPDWATAGDFFSITRTDDELSIVVEEASLPPVRAEDMPVESDWIAYRVVGTLDFALTGILAQITTMFAAENISVFAISTFDTDIVMVKSGNADRADQLLGVSISR